MTEILRSKVLYQAGAGTRKFLTTHELTLLRNGKERPYYMITRGQEERIPTAAEKKPDAVIIVATIIGDDGKKRLVLTSEFRAPIGARELSFPAGLIDPADYAAGGTMEDIAGRAACREFREEVGLTLMIQSFSPPNLYSSAGMTNESVMIVFGVAHGTPTTEHNEGTEDIQIRLLDIEEITKMIQEPNPDIIFSKVGWPLLWAYSKTGL